MCGILFRLFRKCPVTEPCPLLLDTISRRGPDSLRTHQVEKNGDVLTFTSSVLALRGSEITIQPLVEDESGSVLCWNGEAWRLDGKDLARDNDTVDVFNLFRDASTSEPADFIKAIRSIEGPFAFVFYDAHNARVWYGRDCLGRRSLLIRETDEHLEIASVGIGKDSKEWKEVDADGVYMMNLKTNQTLHVPLVEQGIEVDGLSMEFPFGRLNTTETFSTNCLEDPSPSDELLGHLRASMKLRTAEVPSLGTFTTLHTDMKPAKVAVLFSGGLDCTVLARLAHEFVPTDEPIELLNVAFENLRVAKAAETNSKPTKKKQKKKKGVTEEEEAEQPVVSEVQTDDTPRDVYDLCPDRRTGIQSYEELKRTCPDREWRFIKVNVAYSEVLSERQKILSLLHPHNTQMDLSIGMAFYFASRGIGLLHTSTPSTTSATSASTNTPYTSHARILLSGLGADELFAGYQRHATAFRRGGHTALIAELQLDVSRLGKRNLGRDDRVLSDWGREARFPFLDERVVGWALDMPVMSKCAFGMEGMDDEEAGKAVLRRVAKMLGMEMVAREKKRAIQFGARSAKMELGAGRGVKGTDVLH
ncbi:hypothetical protein BJ508DRAFT_417291 [Ascobolus immersus RN42]|uniref:Glutamine amidotransferase type-2 domain-containing protein n=1 Tax=Ascobolus immersus RN42 TaxID=1160509 RepID=A0A3N4HYY5_ASCIM|nr:hypothetical protein BJ508DRAFT_417291 [Ascobolus immersus RN42]